MSRPSAFSQRKTLTKGVLYCTPFVLFFLAVLCFVFWLNQYLLADSVFSDYYSLLFRGSVSGSESSRTEASLIESESVEGEVIEGDFSTPYFGTQWATMNVDGWEEKDIPVFYGNSSAVLHAGAGQAQFSRFCGQNGKVVLSAHVNLHFYEIEDSAARVQAGEEVLVTLDTLWGKYVYRVREVVLFDHLDASPLLPEEGAETLFFYTCYPRENALAYKSERIGLQCELVSGATWSDYVS